MGKCYEEFKRGGKCEVSEEVMGFIIQWLIFYVAIMSAMCIDNYFWIPADKQWFLHRKLQPHFYILVVFGREYIFPKTKYAWSFVWNRRVKEVISHPYDIVPAVIVSFVLAVIL